MLTRPPPPVECKTRRAGIRDLGTRDLGRPIEYFVLCLWGTANSRRAVDAPRLDVIGAPVRQHSSCPGFHLGDPCSCHLLFFFFRFKCLSLAVAERLRSRFHQRNQQPTTAETLIHSSGGQKERKIKRNRQRPSPALFVYFAHTHTTYGSEKEINKSEAREGQVSQEEPRQARLARQWQALERPWTGLYATPGNGVATRKSWRETKEGKIHTTICCCAASAGLCGGPFPELAERILGFGSII